LVVGVGVEEGIVITVMMRGGRGGMTICGSGLII